MPTRPPRVPTVDIAVYNRPEKAGSTLEARKDRRVTLAPDPRTVIAKPTTRIQSEGANATINDPVQIRNTLHRDSAKSREAEVSFEVRDINIVIAGRTTKYKSVDTNALSENKSPAFAIGCSKCNETHGMIKFIASLDVYMRKNDPKQTAKIVVFELSRRGLEDD